MSFNPFNWGRNPWMSEEAGRVIGPASELAEEGEGLRLEDTLQEQDRAGDHGDQGLWETEADHGRRGPYPFIPVEATLWT